MTPALHGRVRGFTLIEMLVAVAILAVLSTATYRGLTAVLESRAAIERESERWRAVGMLLTRLEQDLAAVAPRAVRDPAGRTLAALAGNAAPAQADGAALAFTRFGAADAPGEFVAPLRVGYRLREGTVELLTWDALDTVGALAPARARAAGRRARLRTALPRRALRVAAGVAASRCAGSGRAARRGGGAAGACRRQEITRLLPVIARGTPQ